MLLITSMPFWSDSQVHDIQDCLLDISTVNKDHCSVMAILLYFFCLAKHCTLMIHITTLVINVAGTSDPVRRMG